MDLVKPRERILKKVRSALIGRSDSGTSADNSIRIPSSDFDSPAQAFVDLLESRGHLAFICSNKYDFLDKFLGYLEEQPKSSVICTDSRLQAYLDSCGQAYFEEETIGAGKPEPLCAAKTAVAETGTIIPSAEVTQLSTRPKVYVIQQEQVISSIKVLFEKFKYRLSQGESDSLTVIQPSQLDEGEEERMAFFILKDHK